MCSSDLLDLSAEQAAAALRTQGLETALPFPPGGVTFGGLQVERVTLVGGAGHTGLNVLDLVRPRDAGYAARALDHSVRAPLRGQEIQVLTADDFVLFKLLATRDRDLEDAASVVRRSHQLMDLDLVRREVEALSSAIEDFDVRARWRDLERRIAG